MGRDDGGGLEAVPERSDKEPASATEEGGNASQGLVPKPRREPDSFRKLPANFSPLQDLLVNKVFATITGWLLSNALRLTVLYVIVGGQEAIMVETQNSGLTDLTPAELAAFHKFKDYKWPRLGGLLIQSLIFIVLLLASAAFAVLARKGKGFHTLRKTYAQSLSYIPAWAWKDFLNDSIAIMQWNNKPAVDSTGTLFHTIWLALACILSALLQLFAETMLLRPPRKGCCFAHLRQALLMLDTSLGLGCGFVMNQVFKHFWYDYWEDVRFQILYVIAMSFWIPTCQSFVQDWQDRHEEDYREVLLRMVNFAILAGNFALGWAWKALIDALSSHIGSPGFLHTTICSVTVTVGGVFLVWLLARRGAKPHTVDSCSLIVGMNIGWTWMDFMAASFFGKAAMTLAALWAVTILNQVFILGLALGFIALRPVREWGAWWRSQEEEDDTEEEEVKKKEENDGNNNDDDSESSDGGNSTGDTDSMVEVGGAANRP